jgi:membrane peptidoglycan carboxypeptidase
MSAGDDYRTSRHRQRASAYRQQTFRARGSRLPTPPKRWRRIMGIGLLLAVVLFGGTLTYVLWTLRDMPDPGKKPAFARSIEIYDRDGGEIAQVKDAAAPGYYQELTLQQMGKWNPIAILAAEDKNFYNHGPIDWAAWIRAAGRDLLHGSLDEGGSTITQEVVNISVNNSAHQRSIFWKIQEAVLAQGLEQRYSKDQILEMYLNRVFYGHDAYGIGTASQVFFGMKADQLDAAEAAFLAGLVRGPAFYDPQTEYANAKDRQEYVLDQMVSMGKLTPQEAADAKKENIQAELRFQTPAVSNTAPHFVDYVIGSLESTLGASVVQGGDLKVYTTLDPTLQSQAMNSVRDGVASLASKGVNNGALLAADPTTGEILAYVGSADFNNQAIGGQFDVVAHGSRQPGSSYKPYVYEAALKDGKVTLASVVPDTRYDYPGSNTPVLDWDNSYEGNITVRQALVRSRNVPAVKVGQMEGMDNVNNLARSMGVTGNLPDDAPAAIGTASISVMANVQGYQVFANQGKLMPLMAVTKVVQDDNRVIFTPQPGQQSGQNQVLNPAQAYLITDVLKQYPSYWDLNWRPQMAGKSGTTGGSTLNQHPDAWMMAYNPKIVIGTWAAKTSADPTTPNLYTSAFGTDVGSTITRTFVNSLPASYQGWYTQPDGLVRGGCGTNELFLAGTQGCGGGVQPPAPQSTSTPVPQTPVPQTPVPTQPPIGPTQVPTTPEPTPRPTPTPRATASPAARTPATRGLARRGEPDDAW